MTSRIASLLFVLCFCAAALPAQSGHVELSPFVGYETPASFPIVNSLQVDRLRANGNISYGASMDFSLSNNFQAEVLWVRNPTSYSVRNAFTGQYSLAYDSTIDQYQFGGLFLFRDYYRKVRPYMAFGAGFTHDSNSGGNPNRTAFAYSFGGGVKYYANRHLGLRADARLIPTFGSSTPGVYCSPFGFCYSANFHNYLWRVNLTGGVIFRF